MYRTGMFRQIFFRKSTAMEFTLPVKQLGDVMRCFASISA